MNKQTDSCPLTPDSYSLADSSPAQLAYLALNGSYGEKLVATLLLESIACPEASQSVIQAFSKGRWTV